MEYGAGQRSARRGASRPLRVGILGAGWITRAHVHALSVVNHVDPLRRPVQVTAVAARREEPAVRIAHDFGIERVTTDWRSVVDDPAVDVVANLQGVGGHREATEAALALGKPVLCEKPLAPGSGDAAAMAEAAARAGVPAACGFNYRYVPAMRLARDIVAAGTLGDLVHFRAVYLQDYAALAAPALAHNGSRAVSDYAHIIDFMRYLGGEAEAVMATAAKLTAYGPDVEDAYVAAVDMRGGGIGSLEASRVARGWKGRQVIELNGTRGSLWWNMEDLNRLHLFEAEETEQLAGFRDVYVTEPTHPWLGGWWPAGHGLGWEQSFVHQWHDFLSAVIDERPLSPHQATFDDGYEAALVCDAIWESARDGKRVRIEDLRPASTLEY